MSAKPTFDRPIAHRGLHDRARGIIENTASAFAAAIERGYAIECDVQLSRDGIPMIFHDDDLDRLTGVAGPVGARTMAELASYTLLDSAAGDTPQRFDEFLARSMAACCCRSNSSSNRTKLPQKFWRRQ
jgi:glycerophosphoryl diester phosphodiesterase